MSTRRRPLLSIVRGVHFGLKAFWHFVGSLIAGTIALAIVLAIMPGISADDLVDVFIAVVLVSVVAAVLMPILGALAGALSWFGVFVVGLLSQGLVIYLGLILTPGIHVDGFWPAFWAAWAYAFVSAILSWLFLIDDDMTFLSHVMRQATRGRRGQPIDDPDMDGVVFVQIDGLPWPVLQLMVSSGDLPTLARWVRSGSHTMREWTARTPCTTPISQAGILHGNTENMPAFRWYEKDLGKLLVSNKPADAAIIESRISDGRGLLVDDGASISNLFSGDATVSLMSMSGMAQGKSGLGPSKSYTSFFMHPYGFPRALILTIGEIMKEHHQSRVQRRSGVEPRIDRKRPYPLLRGVTNVLLRDLNLALIAEQMVNGRKAIYVDFVDYDEIAHHAGPVRPESLKSLTGLDGVLRQLELVAEQVERRYHLVVVSDHGQSQGATFRQRYGRGLEDVVHELMGGGDLAAVTSSVEDWGPVNTFLSQVGQQDSVSGGVVRRMMSKKTDDGDVALGPSSAEAAAVEDAPKELVVVGSGNLGLVWFAREPGRLTFEDLEAKYAGLVGALANHPGVGWVLVQTEADDPTVVGRDGLHRLASGEIEGVDPLHLFAETAPTDLLRVARFSNAPDLYVGSLFEPATMEVAAFEELVGCHGGLGGWQTNAVLVAPASWPLDEEKIHGAENVHHQLVRWLEALGHRKDIPATAALPGAVEASGQPAGT